VLRWAGERGKEEENGGRGGFGGRGGCGGGGEQVGGVWWEMCIYAIN